MLPAPLIGRMITLISLMTYCVIMIFMGILFWFRWIYSIVCSSVHAWTILKVSVHAQDLLPY